MANIETMLLKIKNRRLFVMAVPAFLGLLAGGVLVVRPGLGSLDHIKSDVIGLQQKVSAYLFILESEKKTDDYATRFSGDKTWLIEQINQLAEKNGVSIVAILPEDPKKVGEFLSRTSVHIDAESNYHQLGAFISRLESLDAYVKILGVEINAENSSGIAAPNMGVTTGGPMRGRTPQTEVYDISVSVGLFTPETGRP